MSYWNPPLPVRAFLPGHLAVRPRIRPGRCATAARWGARMRCAVLSGRQRDAARAAGPGGRVGRCAAAARCGGCGGARAPSARPARKGCAVRGAGRVRSCWCIVVRGPRAHREAVGEGLIQHGAARAPSPGGRVGRAPPHHPLPPAHRGTGATCAACSSSPSSTACCSTPTTWFTARPGARRTSCLRLGATAAGRFEPARTGLWRAAVSIIPRYWSVVADLCLPPLLEIRPWLARTGPPRRSA